MVSGDIQVKIIKVIFESKQIKDKINIYLHRVFRWIKLRIFQKHNIIKYKDVRELN